MFNMTGSEVMFLLIIGLVVLGPEKLPDAIRRVGKLYAELKRMSSGVQTDFRKVMDEPIKEMMNTTNSMKALFTDTASEFQAAAKEIVEPTFVPYSERVEESAQNESDSDTDSDTDSDSDSDSDSDTDIADGIANAARFAQQREETFKIKQKKAAEKLASKTSKKTPTKSARQSVKSAPKKKTQKQVVSRKPKKKTAI